MISLLHKLISFFFFYNPACLNRSLLTVYVCVLFKEAGVPPGKHIHLHTHLRTQSWKCPGHIFQHNVKVNMQARSDWDSCFFYGTMKRNSCINLLETLHASRYL